MNTIKTIQEALGEILDIDENEIQEETYIVRELGAESIDLLELGVLLNSRLKIKIVDDEIFLGTLRLYLKEADDDGINPDDYISKKYPFLKNERIKEILGDLDDGPVLKVKDIVSYIEWRQ